MGVAACGMALTCQVPMNIDRSVTATFVKPVLSVTVVGAGTVTIPTGIDCTEAMSPCIKTYNLNAMIGLTASSALVVWDEDCLGTVGDTCSLTMNVSKSVTATFP